MWRATVNAVGFSTTYLYSLAFSAVVFGALGVVAAAVVSWVLFLGLGWEKGYDSLFGFMSIGISIGLVASILLSFRLARREWKTRHSTAELVASTGLAASEYTPLHNRAGLPVLALLALVTAGVPAYFWLTTDPQPSDGRFQEPGQYEAYTFARKALDIEGIQEGISSDFQGLVGNIKALGPDELAIKAGDLARQQGIIREMMLGIRAPNDFAASVRDQFASAYAIERNVYLALAAQIGAGQTEPVGAGPSLLPEEGGGWYVTARIASAGLVRSQAYEGLRGLLVTVGLSLGDVRDAS